GRRRGRARSGARRPGAARRGGRRPHRRRRHEPPRRGRLRRRPRRGRRPGVAALRALPPPPVPRRRLPPASCPMTVIHTTPRAAVYDRGYRPYQGPRGGRREATLALWRLSVRRALGLRRSWRQKVFPWSLLVITTVPAIVDVGIAYAIRDDPFELARLEFLTYREHGGVSTSLLVFVALAAPDVVCPDRARRVLPLLFSRPLTGVDYVVAKVAAITTIVFGFAFLPHVVLFVGQMLVADGALDYVTDNLDVLWKVPV